MVLKALKCPECRANLEIESGRHFCYCEYCGSKIVVDDGKQEKTITKNISINKHIDITSRYIDDADVIRAQHESKKDKANFRQVLIIMGILFLLAAVCFGISRAYTVSEEREKNNALSEGKISAGSHSNLIGEDYQSVEAHLKAAGFTNIELIDLDDSGLMFWTEGEVESISIGGDMDFTSSDYFYPDVKIIISYH